jgi:hypothetical protein
VSDDEPPPERDASSPALHAARNLGGGRWGRRRRADPGVAAGRPSGRPRRWSPRAVSPSTPSRWPRLGVEPLAGAPGGSVWSATPTRPRRTWCSGRPGCGARPDGTISALSVGVPPQGLHDRLRGGRAALRVPLPRRPTFDVDGQSAVGTGRARSRPPRRPRSNGSRVPRHAGSATSPGGKPTARRRDGWPRSRSPGSTSASVYRADGRERGARRSTADRRWPTRSASPWHC